MAPQSLVGRVLLTVQASRSHSNTPQSVGLHWTSDQPVAETLPDNKQNPQETAIHATGGIGTRNRSKRSAADPRLRQRGHWDRHSVCLSW